MCNCKKEKIIDKLLGIIIKDTMMFVARMGDCGDILSHDTQEAWRRVVVGRVLLKGTINLNSRKRC